MELLPNTLPAYDFRLDQHGNVVDKYPIIAWKPVISQSQILLIGVTLMGELPEARPILLDNDMVRVWDNGTYSVQSLAELIELRQQAEAARHSPRDRAKVPAGD